MQLLVILKGKGSSIVDKSRQHPFVLLLLKRKGKRSFLLVICHCGNWWKW